MNDIRARGKFHFLSRGNPESHTKTLAALLLLTLSCLALPIAADWYRLHTGRASVIALLLMVTSLAVITLMFSLGRVRFTSSRYAAEARRRDHDDADMLQCTFVDEATALPNRSAVQLRLEELLSGTGDLALMLFQVGGVGCGTTDAQHLQLCLERVQACLQPEDMLGRYDEDMFALILRGDMRRHRLDSIAASVIGCISVPHVDENELAPSSVQLGIACRGEDGDRREALLLAAERAMYAARRCGGNCFRYATDVRNHADVRREWLATRLEEAVRDSRLNLVYQPIYEHGESMVAVEALCRWHDPGAGEIPPIEFIPLAEATGLIVPLSDWVLQEACSQMSAWLAMGCGLERVAVNVSALQVWRADFVTDVLDTLAKARLAPERLELELTEGALIQDFATVKEHLLTLRRIGVRIAIDDFGTGYSSLGRLHELDVDVLKIDRVFLQDDHSGNGMTMIHAMISMAHALGMNVVVEGVETPAQAEALRAMGCNQMQGYLLGRPMPAHAITAELHRLKSGRLGVAAEQPRLRIVPRPA